MSDVTILRRAASLLRERAGEVEPDLVIPRGPAPLARRDIALALAEDVTRLPVPERRDWDNGSLTDEQVSAISWLAIAMNTWNRIAIRSHYPVGP